MDRGLSTRPGRVRISDDSVDRSLLTRIVHRDRGALRELHETYYHPLLRFIYRITGRLDLAQEGVNDVMLVVWRSSHTFDGRSTVSTWIMGIAYRKGSMLVAASHRWTNRIVSTPVDELVERSAPGTAHSVNGELLDDALRHLPPEHLAVFELTYFYGCSYEEIAAIAACPVNTVKTRLFHARAKLKPATATRPGFAVTDGPLDHARAFELLPWLVNGSLPPAERDSVEQHTRTCITCRREWREQRGLQSAIRSQPTIEATPQLGLEQLDRELDGEAHVAATPWRRRAAAAGPFAVATAAGIALLVFLLWLALSPGTAPTPYSTLATPAGEQPRALTEDAP